MHQKDLLSNADSRVPPQTTHFEPLEIAPGNLHLKKGCLDVENGLEDVGRGKGKLGRSERVALTYIHYQM